MADYRGKKVLVTGSNGFVGAHLMARLMAQGAEVTGLVRSSSDHWRFDALEIAPQVLTCDLDDKVKLDALLSHWGAEYVFHLAAERDRGKLGLADAQERSACSGVNVMQATASERLARFISVGSSLEVPDTVSGQPSGLHGKSKARELQALRTLAETLNLPYSPTRTHYVYGPLQAAGKLVPVAVKAARAGLTVSLTGPEIRKRYVYVLDFVDALLKVPDLPATPYDVQLITCTQQVSNLDVVEKIATLVGKPISILSGDFSAREFDRSDWILSESGTPLPGWQARTSLVDGLRSCVEWEAKAFV